MSGFLVRMHQHRDLLTRDGVDGQGYNAGFGEMIGDGGTTSFFLYAASNGSIRSGDAQKDKRAKAGITDPPLFGVVEESLRKYSVMGAQKSE